MPMPMPKSISIDETETYYYKPTTTNLLLRVPGEVPKKPKKRLSSHSRAKRNRRAFSTMALAESSPKKKMPKADASGQRRGGFRGRRGDPHTGGRLDAACGLTGANNSQPTNRELFALNQVLPTETEIKIMLRRS